MIAFSDYKQIVEDSGKRYLFNEKAFNEKRRVLDSVDQTLAKVRDWLAANEFPTTGEFVLGALFDPDFLRWKLVEDTEKSNARLKLPKHVAKIHISAAEAAAAELNTEVIEALRAELVRLQTVNGLQFQLKPEHFYMTQDGAKVERKTVEEALRRGCLVEIPQAMEEAAALVKDFCEKARPLMDKGAPMFEAVKIFLGNYLAPSDYHDFSDMVPVLAYLTVNQRASRALVRLRNRDQFYLMGGKDTPQEKELAAQRANND